MGVEIKKSKAYFINTVTVEEAEDVFNWFLKQKKPKVDLSKCKHLHSAVLQLFLIFKPEIIKFPEDEELKVWLETTFLLSNP